MIKEKSKTSISVTCNSALRQSYITFQHRVLCIPVTLTPPPSCSSGTQCHNAPVRKKFCWVCLFFIKALYSRARGQKGRCSRWGLRPLDAVEKLRQFADVLDGVLQGLYFGEGLAPLAVGGGQVVTQSV